MSGHCRANVGTWQAISRPGLNPSQSIQFPIYINVLGSLAAYWARHFELPRFVGQAPQIEIVDVGLVGGRKFQHDAGGAWLKLAEANLSQMALIDLGLFPRISDGNTG